MSVPYTSLVVATDVDTEREDSSSLSLGDSSTLSAMESVIQAVTGSIEGAMGLDRKLIVRQYTQYISREEWEYDTVRELYYIRVPQWPIVQVDTSGFTTGIPSGDDEVKLLLYTSRYEGAVTYYAGYRRSEQTLASLQGETGLSGLTTLPGALPYDIRDAAIDLVLYKMTERRQGPGTRTKNFNAAVGSSTITSLDPMYPKRVIKERIWHHKRLPC